MCVIYITYQNLDPLKKKINELDFRRVKIFCSVKATIKRTKRNDRLEENIWQVLYFIKDISSIYKDLLKYNKKR